MSIQSNLEGKGFDSLHIQNETSSVYLFKNNNLFKVFAVDGNGIIYHYFEIKRKELISFDIERLDAGLRIKFDVKRKQVNIIEIFPIEKSDDINRAISFMSDWGVDYEPHYATINPQDLT